MDSDTIAGVVKAQVENPRPSTNNPSVSMPADLVTGEDLEDVASYVASVAGAPGIKGPQLPDDPGATGVRQQSVLRLPHPEGGRRRRHHGPRPRQGDPGPERRRGQEVDRRPQRQDRPGLPGRDAQELRPADQPAGARTPWSSSCSSTRARRAASRSRRRRAGDQAAVSAAPAAPAASASRSTTTWVIGSGTSRRARSTTPRSSHLDLWGGWVEMITSSAAK